VNIYSTNGDVWDLYATFCETRAEPKEKVLKLRIKGVRTLQSIGWADDTAQCKKIVDAIDGVEQCYKRHAMTLNIEVLNFIENNQMVANKQKSMYLNSFAIIIALIN